MRVMLLASAFNSLTQRVHTELREAGHHLGEHRRKDHVRTEPADRGAQRVVVAVSDLDADDVPGLAQFGVHSLGEAVEGAGKQHDAHRSSLPTTLART